MRVKDGRGGVDGVGGQSSSSPGGVVGSSKMSTLDYLVTKMRRHVRAPSADSSSPATPTMHGHTCQISTGNQRFQQLYQNRRHPVSSATIDAPTSQRFSPVRSCRSKCSFVS
ncbi:putative serine/arginine repetitive matrix protein 2-like 3 [Homarus americanus]|uniref:Putative serine/arginine repetitive matrix protein 2-like 3 n=1 Tax=Homarus americanus TaxID=6706 RepID=A0A8J5KF04_HOMAM|nr:putative serine/arginine repetitive matrix protein 2-like 3 [Homarus americanus]